MNKLMYIFVVLFLLIICVAATADVEDYTVEAVETTWPAVTVREEALADSTEETQAETTVQTVPEEDTELFIAVSDNAPHNRELQVYMPQQVEIGDREVKIKADRLGEGYISGKVESTMAVRYGTFSFRVNTIKGKGLFPAIWMLPEDSSDGFPEIDIYELVGDAPHEFWCVRHYKTDNWKRNDNLGYRFPKNDIPETYVLRFEWTPEALTWYLEEEEIYSIENEVPDMPMYMIINLAVGGNWPGDPTPNTTFPTTFHVEILEYNPTEVYPR